MHSKTSPELLTCRSGVFSTYSRLPRFRGQPSTVLSQCETLNYRTKQLWWSLPSLLLLISYKTELLKLIYLQDHMIQLTDLSTILCNGPLLCCKVSWWFLLSLLYITQWLQNRVNFYFQDHMHDPTY